MVKKLFFLTFCMFFFALLVTAQDVPDEIDDPDGDWDEVIEQLDDSGYIDENNGDLVFEESRVRLDDDEQFVAFDTDELTNFVMAATLQMDELDDDEYGFCMLTFRDDFDIGFLGAGIDSFGSVVLVDQVFDEDESAVVDSDDHGEDVDEEIHLIVIALEDEVTVYVDGELFFEEDDLNEREGVLGLFRTDNTDCDADDVWIWEIEDTGRRSSSNDDDDDDRDSGDSELPDEIDDYNGPSEGVIEQFVDAGILGTGNAFLFGENYTFISASGFTFYPLGRGRNRSDVVLGGELTFTSASSNYEGCGLMVRLNDNFDPAEDFLIVGLDSDGNLFLQNSSRTGEDVFDIVSLDLDLDDPHHFILIARGDTLSVYVDGELALENYEIYEERGIFGIGQFTDSTGTRCEASNIWVYDTPYFEPGVCNVLASGTVNRREEPNTSSSIPGQMVSGETLQVEAQTEPGDGYIWYELEDGSYIREDIISLIGDCGDIPEN